MRFNYSGGGFGSVFSKSAQLFSICLSAPSWGSDIHHVIPKLHQSTASLWKVTFMLPGATRRLICTFSPQIFVQDKLSSWSCAVEHCRKMLFHLHKHDLQSWRRLTPRCWIKKKSHVISDGWAGHRTHIMPIYPNRGKIHVVFSLFGLIYFSHCT